MSQPFFIFEVTPRCGHDCVYCYNVWKEGGGQSLPDELSFERVTTLFDRLAKDIDFEWVMLSGGEPLLYSLAQKTPASPRGINLDLEKTIAFLKSKGLKVGMATSGVGLDALTAERLCAAGIDYFEVSLDSLEPDVYQRLTGRDTVSDVKQAILNIKEQRRQLSVSVVLTRLNVDGLEDVLDFCFAASVDYVALNRFIPGGRGRAHVEALMLTTPELKNVLTRANDKASTYPLTINVTLPVEPCEIPHGAYPRLTFGTCVCGVKKWVIDPEGNLRICEQSPVVLGNLLDKPFSALSRSPEVAAFRRQNRKEECARCEQLTVCGGGCRFLKRDRVKANKDEGQEWRI